MLACVTAFGCADAPALAELLRRLLEEGPPPRATAAGESWEQDWRRLALPALAGLAR